jgi:hypothetical protein
MPVSKKNEITTYSFSATFTAADAAIGKVTFKATATVVGARDGYPIDTPAPHRALRSVRRMGRAPGVRGP